MAASGEAAQDLLFSIALTGISRFFVLRDFLLRYRGEQLPQAPYLKAARHRIVSGKNQLDAVFVSPNARPPRAALLICHGIGERVHYWFGVQQLLALNGIASLVFDYSGYGRSTGIIQAHQLEQDAVSAFYFLQQLAPDLPSSILGFSLGTGIAVAVIQQLPAHHLILGSGYTSFRNAARRVGVPRRLVFLAPDLWDSERALRDCRIPVLILHGQDDRLFPVRMAAALHAACNGQSKLIIFPRMRHDDPYYRPSAEYWELVADACALPGRPYNAINISPKASPFAPSTQ